MILLYFFVGVPHVSAATINLDSTAKSYQVGDTIAIRVAVTSSTSINAVSAQISFSKDLLTLTSISKTPSLVSLWAQDPTYSNSTGTASFEGIILDGYKGIKGTVTTLFFKAKSVGTAHIEFSSASILANDGNGTEVLSGKSNSIITITKALPGSTKEVEPVEEKVPEKPVVGTPITSPIPPVTEIKNIVHYFSYTLFTSIIAAVFLLFLGFFVLFTIYYKHTVRKSLKKKLLVAESHISKDFKLGGKNNKDVERAVLDEIKDIEKEL